MQLDIVGGCPKMHFGKVATLWLAWKRRMFVGGTNPKF